MVRLATVLALSIATAASGQVGLLQIQVGGTDKVVVSPSDCGGVIQASWTASAQQLACSSLSFWVTLGECGDAAGAGDQTLPEVAAGVWNQQRTGNFTIPVNELPAFTGQDAGACGATGVEKKHRLCGAFSSAQFDCGTGKSVTRASNPPAITYDSLAPGPPTIDDVVAQDSALVVNFTPPSGATQVHVDARAQGAADFARAASASGEAASVRIERLVNNTTYEVRALAEDAAGNLSEPSELAAGTPLRTEGFFSNYRRAGGAAQGCTSGGTGGLALIAAWVIRRLSSRRIRP
ncbi:MAG: fibronectin type III domain-containing protein [Myxococcales bacterium]|nr:fibronectin type III domain-containing protein [Myxococcales bacterium]